jgi:nicotinate dehydrogenase subunit B
MASWIEIRSDGTILVRTGRTEIGTGASGFYSQVVAEELNVRPESITLIMGDTDRTPDGGYSAGFLTGAANLRKVSAYTCQGLLGLAATQLGLPVASLSVTDGVVSGGGKSVSYGELIQGQQLELEIPVTGKSARVAPAGANSIAGLDWEGMDGLVVVGDPPTRAARDYKVIGKSFPMPVIPDKVTGKTQWSCDVMLPGMLHARMVRPATIGSTLISTPELDKKLFPRAEVITKGNLVAVVSPDEWEAIRAAQAVATKTKWTAWSGLPGSEHVAATLRQHNWGEPDQSRGNSADVKAALAGAAQTLDISYEQGYLKHAPIGPYVAVADVSSDGTVTVWSHSAHAQALRARMANMLGTNVGKVVVRCLEHAGQFGRTTFGGDGAEADAVILSKLTGKPVRVQWTLQDDLAWSATSPAWVSDIKAGLDAQGNLTAVHSSFYSPHMLDARPLGAILAGMPAGTTKPGGFLATEWPYDRIKTRLEQVYARTNIGAESPYGGLRGLIMRTPGQRQQNFVLESLINEAAAATKADAIQFRLQHTTNERVVAILNAVAQAATWQERPSPSANAGRRGSDPLTGRGVCIMVRAGSYWAAVAELTVTQATGAIQVTKFTIGVDCGTVINPRQLDRCVKGGVVMGLSEALKEQVTFDSGRVTSTDWGRYKILTMAEMPEIKVIQISRDDKGFGGGGEAPNALVPPAVAAAFFDATGVPPRRLPLTPAYVTSLLKG